MEVTAECGECGNPLALSHAGACPACGSNRRHITAADVVKINVREKVHWKKTREYFENHPLKLFVVVVLTIVAATIGLAIAGIPGVLASLLLSAIASWIGFTARTKVRHTDHGGSS
jgi:hypothetical protein